MFGRILILIGTVSVFLGTPTDSYARDRGGVRSHNLRAATVRPARHFSTNRAYFRSRGHFAQGLWGALLETVIDEAINHIADQAVGTVSGPSYYYADYNDMIAMHYELDARYAAEQARSSKRARQLRRPLDPPPAPR